MGGAPPLAGNYNAETGEPLDQPDTEGFYNWGALMPLMAVAMVMDVSPWDGWEIANDGEDLRLGPLQSPAGAVTVSVEQGTLTLTCGEAVLFRTAMLGRFRNLHVSAAEVAFDLPDTMHSGGEVVLPGSARGQC
jgi:putative isomerase